MRLPVLTLKDVVRRFGNQLAVNNVSFEVNEGELFTILGPSGCGKSTTLRMIAGFEEVDHGEIRLREQTIVSPQRRIFVPIQRRNMGMVFQSYAIWPHLSIFQNVAYPLDLRHVPKAEARERVQRAIALVGLDGFGERMASTISGGQQQRVALARALVYEPDVLLLDEPFSSLDLKLREQLRLELRKLQRRLNVTVVMVTHDQTEALSLSDRIAVMSDGKVEQIGSPQDLYQRPASPFVRDFIGRCNKIAAHFVRDLGQGMAQVTLQSGTTITGRSSQAFIKDQNVVVSIRPEDVEVLNAGALDGDNQLAGTVETMLYMGDHSECYMRSDCGEIVALRPNGTIHAEDHPVAIRLPQDAVRIWP